MDAGIEVGDRHSAADVERLGATVAGAGNQGVVDEVDRDLEGRIAMVQAPGGEAAHVDVQRGVPPVVTRAVVASRILPRICPVEVTQP